MRRPRSSALLTKLLAAYLVPTLCLFGVFGWLAYRVTARSLEDSLGRRLCAVAQAAGVQLRPQALLFLAPGDDGSRTARRIQQKLSELAQRTGVARVVVLDRELRALADTRGQMRIGDRHYNAEADRPELGRVFEGRAASSVLFRGADERIYKTGYAPVFDGGQAVAAVGVEGSAEFFAVLERLRRYLLLLGAVVAALVVGASVLVARRITRPLRRLADEAARIGAGDLERPITAVAGRDEVGLLASTMNEMRRGLFARDQQMQLMLSGIAHEVRNPLGGIELFSGLLREELQDQEEALQMLGRIEREMGYLKKVVEDFLAFARRTPQSPTEVDLGELLAEVVELLAADAEARGVTLRRPEPAEEVTVRCDREQVRRAVINLVRNGLQASAAGGEVTVTAARGPGGCGAIRVADQGPGIPPETLKQVFQPFFTTREKGSGLGLSLARKIAEEHGGALSVESAPGKGAAFTLELPPKNRDTKGGSGLDS